MTGPSDVDKARIAIGQMAAAGGISFTAAANAFRATMRAMNQEMAKQSVLLNAQTRRKK